MTATELAAITLTACTLWAAIIIKLCVWAHDREVRMIEEAMIMTKPAKDATRRVRFVLCPDCGVPTRKGRNEPHDTVSLTQCHQCYMVFESTDTPSWLAWTDPLTGGVRDDD